MSKTIINLKNPTTGTIKTVTTGFSWLTLFFGVFVPIARRDWKNALYFLPFYVITLGLASIPFAFIYNKIYIKSLFEEGYNLLYFTGSLCEKDLSKLIECPTIERKMKLSATK